MIQTVTPARIVWRGAFILLLLLAFGPRMYLIEGHDIWGDEAWSITVANWPLAEVITGDTETNPPLYHVLLYFAIRLFGQTPLGIRYLSVICGIMTVALLIRLGWEIGGRRLAFGAGLAAALSPFLIYHAQDARMYGTALVGSSASLLAFVMIYKRQMSGRPIPIALWFVYGATSLVGVYSHYYAFAILLAQAGMVTTVALSRSLDLSHREAEGDRLRQAQPASRQGQLTLWRWLLPWITIWACMALLFVPWLLVHASFLGGKASGRFDELTLNTFLVISRRTLLAFGGGTTLSPQQAVWSWSVVALAMMGLATLFIRRQQAWPGGLLTIVLIVGFIFAWVVNPIMPFYWERYLLVIIPAFVLAVAVGLESLYRLWQPLAVAGLALLAGTAYVSLSNYFLEPAFVKGEYGRLMNDIQQRAQPDDLILLNNPLQGSLYDYYGPDGLAAQMIPRDRLLTEEDTALIMAELTGGRRRVWLVETGNPAEYDPHRRAQGWLSRQGSQGFFQSYPGATLSLFILVTASEMETVLEANFNDELWLIGYSLELSTVTAGDPLLLTLFWRTGGPIAHNYTIFTHLLDETGQVRAQMDSQPVAGTRPTSTWLPGETIADNYALLLPEDLLPGRYWLQVGAYLWPELIRLPLLAEDGRLLDDKLVLQEVVIE